MTPAPPLIVMVMSGARLWLMTTEFLNLAQVAGEHVDLANVELGMRATYPQVTEEARKRVLPRRAVGLGQKCHWEEPFKRTQWSNMLFCPPAHRSNKQ